MPFNQIQKSRHSWYHDSKPIMRMGAHLQTKQGTSRGIYFSMSHEFVKKVGWRITKPDQDSYREVVHITIQEGVGEDAGFLLLVETDRKDGYSAGTTSNSAKSFSLSVGVVALKHYVLNEVPVPTEEVEFTIDEENHTVLVQCPDWLRYNPLSYTAPPPPPQKETPKPNPTKAVVDRDRKLRVVVDTAAKVAMPELNRKDRRSVVAATTRSLR